MWGLGRLYVTGSVHLGCIQQSERKAKGLVGGQCVAARNGGFRAASGRGEDRNSKKPSQHKLEAEGFKCGYKARDSEND